MFSSAGLFQKLRCPDQNCSRPRDSCIFSHQADLAPPPPLKIPAQEQVASSSRQGSSTVPAKRPFSPPKANQINNFEDSPPQKLLKTGTAQKPRAVPVASSSSDRQGPPILKVAAAMSTVAVPVRQTMLTNLYNHFMVLYQNIAQNPHLASEHALKQEQEIYQKSNKLTYRNAVIHSIASLKRRSLPDSPSHESVGTEAEIAARAVAKNAISSLTLTRAHLVPYIVSLTELENWGYITAIPDGPGGTQPSKEGQLANCERCGQPFQVRRDPGQDECFYHHGKAYGRKIGGERIRVYTCCGKSLSDADGCTRGPHVFNESDPVDLHARHAFSFLSDPTAADPSCLDFARISAVDGSGKEIFDELVRMDDGVEIMCAIPFFSPETHCKALLPLASIRKSLDSFINSETILIGHGLENDLRTLRIIHHKCVDTAILFPHKSGAPFRRSLKDLVREHLNQVIQQGDGTTGHSSVEDCVAALNLVKFKVINNK
ncbi:hypothetical protein C8J56DRAFT_934282 [Mycena floridula]|nr:hypothetical protein C8J56DRAFT_934282 [Mycena floridula]